MAIEEVVGDLFDTELPAMAHGCNCAGAMGKGIAVEFKDRWPGMYAEYKRLCKAGDYRPGDVFVWEAEEATVFNLGTEKHWRSGAIMDAIEASAAAMVPEATSRGITEVAMPRIGAGYGGLPWKDVRAVLEHALRDLTIVVYRLE